MYARRREGAFYLVEEQVRDTVVVLVKLLRRDGAEESREGHWNKWYQARTEHLESEERDRVKL